MHSNLKDGQVVAIFGPTGIGKTAVALQLANLLKANSGVDSVAVSADALQVYQGIETLTGAASTAEQKQLEHRMVSFLPVDRQFSVGEYAELAHREIDSLLAEGKTVIVVGGTGMYLRAALTELSLQPPSDPKLRSQLSAELASEGLEPLYKELVAGAPWIAERVEQTDTQRILRSLELLRQGVLEEPTGTNQLWTDSTRRPTALFGLTMERQQLKQQIDRRVDSMVANGATEEAARAMAANACNTVQKAVGLRELLAGDIERMKIKTHQYSRRQMTWMRKLQGVSLIDTTDYTPESTAEEIFKQLPAA